MEDEVIQGVEKFLKSPSCLFKYRTSRLRLYANGKITNLKNSCFGNGTAKRLMQKVCRGADKCSLSLWLWAKPSEGSSLLPHELVNFYRKFGFIPHAVDVDGGRVLMIRPIKNERQQSTAISPSRRASEATQNQNQQKAEAFEISRKNC